MTEAQAVRQPDASLVTTLHVTYALHAIGLAIGAMTAASVLGSFIFSWASIIAIIVNYVQRSQGQGTWLESHFTWQIQTFWYAVGLGSIVFIVGLPLILLFGLGFVVWGVGFFVLGLWATYRIVKGWMRLRDQQPVV
jgi:uncharacterized membrane protein